MVESLSKKYPRRWFIPLGLSASALFLVLGLFLPIITLNELVFWKHTFSVLTGVQHLLWEGHLFLALVIFLFSVVFPLFKLIILFQIWFFELNAKQREFYIHWLGVFGKWSMLDVFVVAITIVVTKISTFAKAEPKIGLYFFGLSILLAMVVTEYFDRLIKK